MAEKETLVEVGPAEQEQIQKAYNDAEARNNSLLAEVVFILTERIKSEKIKIHTIESRIKNIESLVDKCKRNHLCDINLVHDVVGARVICLFRSDMEATENIIKTNFDVVEVDDKLAVHNNPLGYVSIHYKCKIPARYKGPRYEKTTDVIFEIQVRTLCMHCWAAVSHHLDYKGDWDVPAELKRALSALSGLFYVADSQFEQFYTARIRSLEQAERGIDVVNAEEINLDTVSAYLRSKFLDRDISPSETISEIVHEIKLAGYQSLKKVDSDIDRGIKRFLEFEIAHPASSPTKRFAAGGAARLSLCLVSDAFLRVSPRTARYAKTNKSDPLLEYRIS